MQRPRGRSELLSASCLLPATMESKTAGEDKLEVWGVALEALRLSLDFVPERSALHSLPPPHSPSLLRHLLSQVSGC